MPPYHYHCPKCWLLYCVGGFHYHWSNEGYWGGTYLVCRGCGTVHSVHHAVRPRGGEQLLPDQKPDEFTTQQQPLFVNPEVANERGKLYGEWIKCEVRTVEALSFSELNCTHCSKVGTLSDTWSVPDETCPRCGTLVTGLH